MIGLLKLPLETRAEQPGCIYDAAGDLIATVDVDNSWLDEDAAGVAGQVVTAVNCHAALLEAARAALRLSSTPPASMRATRQRGSGRPIRAFPRPSMPSTARSAAP